MKVIKGFDQNMKCRGKQYAVGEESTESKAVLCDCGIHAVERPLDVFAYYPPATSRYCEAELEEVSDERRNDTKVVGKKIKIGAEIGIQFDQNVEGHDLATIPTSRIIRGRTGKDGYCLWASEKEIEILEQPKIVITTDGRKTLASLYDGENVTKRAEAKCAPEDAFDFNTGARLAFDRLMAPSNKYEAMSDHDLYAEACHRHQLCTADGEHRMAKCPMYLNPAKNGTGRYEKQEEIKPEPKPVLSGNNGTPGTPTNYRDVLGHPLFVGDIVEHFDSSGKSYGDAFVVQQFGTYCDGKKFVMGIEMCCNDKTGEITNGWKVLRKRVWPDVKNGECIGGITKKDEANA